MSVQETNLARCKKRRARQRGATETEYSMDYKIYQRDEGVCGLCQHPPLLSESGTEGA
jgi:hypothetical protein